MLCVLKAIATWVIMLLVGTNLIGLVVRGLFWRPSPMDVSTERVQAVLARESSRIRTANRVMTFGSSILAIAYLLALFHFWNLGLALAGALVMVSRLPDLIWEIRTGRKPTRQDRPSGPIYSLASTVDWVALVLVWYSLCQW